LKSMGLVDKDSAGGYVAVEGARQRSSQIS